MASSCLKMRHAAIDGMEFVLVASECTLELYTCSSSSLSSSSSSSTSSSTSSSWSSLPPQYLLVTSWKQESTICNVDMKLQQQRRRGQADEHQSVGQSLLILLLCDDGEVSAVEFDISSRRHRKTSLMTYEQEFDGGAVSFTSMEHSDVLGVVVIGVESYVVMKGNDDDHDPRKEVEAGHYHSSGDIEIFKGKTTYPKDNPVRGYKSKAREIIELVPTSKKMDLFAATWKNDWGYIIVRWLGVEVEKNEEDGSIIHKVVIFWEMLTRVTTLQLLPCIEKNSVAFVYYRTLIFMDVEGVVYSQILEDTKRCKGFVAALSLVDAKFRPHNQVDYSRPSSAMSVVSMKSDITSASAFDDSDEEDEKRPQTAAMRAKYVNKPQIMVHLSTGGTFIVDIDLEKKCMRSCTEIYMQSVSPCGEEMFIPFFQYMYILEANWRPTGNSSMTVDYYWILGLNSCFGMQMVRASTVVFDANVTRFCQNVFDRLSDVGIVLMPSPLQSTSKAGCSKNEDLQLMTYHCVNKLKPNSKVACLVNMWEGFSVVYQCQRARLLDSCLKINFEKSQRIWNEQSDTVLMMSGRLPQPPSHQEKLFVVMSSVHQNSSSLATLGYDSKMQQCFNVDITAIPSSPDPPGYGITETEHTLAFNSISTHHSMQVSSSKLVVVSNLDCRRCSIRYDLEQYSEGLELSTLLGADKINLAICKATIIFEPSLPFSCLLLVVKDKIKVFYIYSEGQDGVYIKCSGQYQVRDDMEISSYSSTIRQEMGKDAVLKYFLVMIFSVWEELSTLSVLTMTLCRADAFDNDNASMQCTEFCLEENDVQYPTRITQIHLIPSNAPSSDLIESSASVDSMKCLYCSGETVVVISITKSKDADSNFSYSVMFSVSIPSGVKKVCAHHYPLFRGDTEVNMASVVNAFIVEGFEMDYIIQDIRYINGDESWEIEVLQRFHDHMVGRTTSTYALLPFVRLKHGTDTQGDNSHAQYDPASRIMIMNLHCERTDSSEFHCFESSFLLCTLGSCASYVVRKRKIEGQLVNAVVSNEYNELGSAWLKKLLVFSKGKYTATKDWEALGKEQEPDMSLVVLEHSTLRHITDLKVPTPNTPALSNESLVLTEELSAGIAPRTTLSVFANFTPPIPHFWDLGCTFCVWTGHRPYINLDESEDIKVMNEFVAYSILPGSNELYFLGKCALYDIANDIRKYIEINDLNAATSTTTASTTTATTVEASASNEVVDSQLDDVADAPMRSPIGKEAPECKRRPFDPCVSYKGVHLFPKRSSSFNPPSYCAVSWRSISVIEWRECFEDVGDGKEEDQARLRISIEKTQQITFPIEAVVIAVEALECPDIHGKTTHTIVTSRLAIGLSIYSYCEKRLQNVFNLPFAHGFVTEPFLRFSSILNPVDVGGNERDSSRKFIILCADRLLQYFYEIELFYTHLIPKDLETMVSSENIMKSMLTRKYDLTEDFLISLKKVVRVISFDSLKQGNDRKEKTETSPGIFVTWVSTAGSIQMDKSLDVDFS